MIRNSRGYGILSLIISLGVMVAFLYFVMLERGAEKSNEAVLDQIDRSSTPKVVPSTAVPAACAPEAAGCSVK
jgi:hypothetical protein